MPAVGDSDGRYQIDDADNGDVSEGNVGAMYMQKANIAKKAELENKVEIAKKAGAKTGGFVEEIAKTAGWLHNLGQSIADAGYIFVMRGWSYFEKELDVDDVLENYNMARRNIISLKLENKEEERRHLKEMRDEFRRRYKGKIDSDKFR